MEPKNQVIKLLDSKNYTSTPPVWLQHSSSSDSDFLRYFHQILSRKNGNSPETFIHTLENGYIADLCVVYDAAKNVIQSSTQDATHKTDFDFIEKFQGKPIEFIKESVIFLFKAGKSNYGHQLVEMLPKLEVLALSAHGREILESSSIAIPTTTPEIKNIIETTLDIYEKSLDIKIKKIHLRSTITQFEEVIYISPISKHNKTKSDILIPFSERIKKHQKAKSTPSPIKENIFISRQSSQKRRVTNFNSIELILKEQDFEIIDPSQINFQQQVDLFSSAKIIIGTHGAAMTNILFSQPSAIIGMIDPGVTDFFFWDLACIQKQSFMWQIENLGPWTPHKANNDYAINTAVLQEMIRFAKSSPAPD